MFPDSIALRNRKTEPFLMIWASNPAGLRSVVGPARQFRAVGPSLRSGVGKREAMRFRMGAWYRRGTGRGASLLWTEEPTVLRFENPATGACHPLGTFEMVGIICDTIYVEREHSRPVAQLDAETHKWRCCVDGTLWPELLLLPATQMLLPWDGIAGSVQVKNGQHSIVPPPQPMGEAGGMEPAA